MEQTTTFEKKLTMYQQLADIDENISWGALAKEYFNKSASWFYHKMDGIDGNGGAGGFNTQETEQLRNALMDLSTRIRRVAENI